MEVDKRYYSRYKTLLKGKIGRQTGHSFSVEILDISAEGARLRTDSVVSLYKEEIINIVIKWKTSIKAKAEIRWVKNEKNSTEFGIRFTEMDMANREALSSLISEYALSSLSNSYTR